MRENNGSSLSRSISWFSHALSGCFGLLLIPLITKHVRQPVYGYFAEQFSHDWSLGASWAVVGLASVCALFGLSALLQMVIQVLFYRVIQRGGY